jgi:hypothetical protein
MAERLALVHLCLLFDEGEFAQNRGKEEIAFGPTSFLCFVLRYRYQITSYVYRAHKFAKKPDQHEMISGDGAAPKSEAWTRAPSKNPAAAGEIE